MVASPLRVCARPWAAAVNLASATSLCYFPGQTGGLRLPIRKTSGAGCTILSLKLTLLFKSCHCLIRKGERERKSKKGKDNKTHRPTLSPVDRDDVNRVAVTLMN